MDKTLSKIKQVDLRSVWPHEAGDFTKWLAEEDNLSALGEEIGIEIELIETESSVGAFSADIFAQESISGRKIVIENQLEDTNHDHLGKIITYAAGKDAQMVVWVVRHARDEHKQAIEWLNDHTDSEFGFFLVEIELWQIDGSNPAPRFNVVGRPNNWAKAIKASEGLSDTKKLYLQYWQRYAELAEAHSEFRKVFRPQKPGTDHWSNLAIGSSKCHIELTASTMYNRVSVGLYVPDDKETAQIAIDAKEVLAEAVGVEASPFEASKAAGVRFCKMGCDLKADSAIWDEFITWQLEASLRLRAALQELGI